MPVDERLLRKNVEKGQEAKNILESEVFREVGGSINKEFQSAFKGDDEEKAWEARREARTFEKILGRFHRLAQKGDQSQKKLNELRDKKENIG